MLDTTQVTHLAGAVTGAMFTNPHDETIFDAINYAYTATGTTDLLIVTDYLTQTGKISTIPGGPSYLHQLISTPAPQHSHPTTPKLSQTPTKTAPSPPPSKQPSPT